ncbi:MAG TPA: TrkH family potassium uptake protein [Gaiellaceae bacterium]|nr:TrkH family potassium uptake protein [Gaiellaceae bacterium]
MITTARLRRAFRRETIGVDVEGALDLVGTVLKWTGAAFLVPAAVALAHGEPTWPFVVSAGITSAFGWALEQATEGKERIAPREGFFVVALVWLLVPVFGALPYVLSAEPQLASPVNAYFESVSGFTASGATVLTEIEALPRGLLLWRQFSQWLGGVGIVILAIAVLPRLRVGGRQLLNSELPGPTEVERLSVSIRDTARRLWVVYVALTAAMAGVLWLYAVSGLDDEMTLFDAVSHAFSGVALAGFSPRSGSVGEFAAITQWTVVLFMVVAGINFLRLHVVIVQRRARTLARDEELRLYFVLLGGGAALLLTILLAGDTFQGEAALRHAVFQAVSIMTTTGFASTDYVLWGPLAAVVIVGLMFLGASAGSTSGSIKVVRHLLIGRLLRRELDQTVHAEVVLPIRLHGGVVDERALRAVLTFVLLYVGLFAIGSLGLALESFRATGDVAPFEAIAAAAATLGNVGPAMGFAGPFGSYEPFSAVSKLIMCALMWMGRVEIIPVVVLFTKAYWRA